MWLLYILIGLIIGFLLAWFFVGRQHAEGLAESERHWQGRLDAANNELRSATEDNQEIKDRLISLQEEHQICDKRIHAAETQAEANRNREQEAQAKAQAALEAKSALERELDQAKNVLAKERARFTNLQADVDRLEHAVAASKTKSGEAVQDGRLSALPENRQTPRSAEGEAAAKRPLLGEMSPSYSIHEEAAVYEPGSASRHLSVPDSPEQRRKLLRKLDQKIAQLPRGSKARLGLENERKTLIELSGSELTKPVQTRIPSPSAALQEPAAAFVETAQAAPLAALSAEELSERRQLKAMNSKIAQLPAGSSARQKLERQRARLLGEPDSLEVNEAEAASNSDEPQALFETPIGNPDNLKRIKGVGPVLEKKLHRLGITKFSQIAAFSADDIARVDDVLDFKGRIERENWIGQASKLARG